MHVAIVTETYPPEVNGVALTVHGLQTGLARAGHRVSVVRPRQRDEAAAAETQDDTLLVRGAPIPRYPELRFGLPAARTLARRWRGDRPDAVYVATEGPLGWSAVRSARRLGIPVASGFHTRFDDYMRRYGFGLLAPVALRWMRRFHNRADGTLVPTAELANFLAGHGFERLHQLGRAVDCVQFDPALRDADLRSGWGLAEEDLLVVHVGRIAAEKNLPLLVHAFRAIQAEQPGARLLWVGDGPERAGLQRDNPDFLFAGVKRGLELGRHFASADLFLFPSLSETFGNVTLEAMASGVALVAYDYGAAREYVVDGEHGLTVAGNEPEAFVTAALRAARDGDLRRRLGAQARQRILGSSPQQIADAFAALLQGLARQETVHA
jgi:glycosyltransferase involved in cell wall biosynthesis